MTLVSYIGIGVGVLGVLFGLNCYYHLWKWGRQCQNARLVISRKGRVKIQPTLVELLLWSRQVQKPDRGQIFYRDGGTSIAILRAVIPPGRIRAWWQRRNQPTPQAQVQTGTWKGTADNG